MAEYSISILKKYFLKLVLISWRGGECLSFSVYAAVHLPQRGVVKRTASNSRPLWRSVTTLGHSGFSPAFSQVYDFKLFQRTLSTFLSEKNPSIKLEGIKVGIVWQRLPLIESYRNKNWEMLKYCFLFFSFLFFQATRVNGNNLSKIIR